MADQKTILESGTTDAVTSDEFVAGSLPCLIAAFGTIGANTGDLQRKAVDGTWVGVTKGGAQVQISDTQRQLIVDGPGTYRVNVPTRTAAWGIDFQNVPRR